MAQRRMVNKKISINEDVASLDIYAQTLFTWMIPHADDLGLLPFSARSIKALVVPMWDKTADEIGTLLESIWKIGVIEVIEYNNTKYIRMKSFNENQTLKKDRQPQTVISLKLKDKPKESWELLENIEKTFGTVEFPFGRHGVPEENGIEVNIREEKRIEYSGDARPVNEEPKIPDPKNAGQSPTVDLENPLQKGGVLDSRTSKAGPLADHLRKKYNFSLQSDKSNRITTPHQDEAFRFAKVLGIDLKGTNTGRWIKIFKEADSRGKRVNLNKAFTYCKDHPNWFEFDNDTRMNMVFFIYENGLKRDLYVGT